MKEMEELDLSGFTLINLTAASTLHQKRLVLELTQQQVADRAGIDLQQYRKFFDGDYSLGEEIYSENGELKYKKTGRLTSDNID